MNQQSEANESFKQRLHQKLEAMLGLCEQTSCRRQTLLAYFDELLEQPCGNCDVCLEPPPSWDATEAARKGLSCVYRTGQRFGVNYVVDVLMGKPHERITRNRHDQISTWNIGGELSNNQWRNLFRQLLVYGYIESDADQHGGLRLTPRAKPLLRGEETLKLREIIRTDKKLRTRTDKQPLDVNDQPLFDKLRALRKTLADENAVPPFVIFHDKTLLEMVNEQPNNETEMAEIHGIGEQKLRRFGEAFLAVIKSHQAEKADLV